MMTENLDAANMILASNSSQGVQRLTLNNSARRNAFSETMLTQLHQAITHKITAKQFL